MHMQSVYIIMEHVETIFVPTVVNSRFDLQINEANICAMNKAKYSVQVFVHLLHTVLVSNLYNLDSITKLFRNSFPFAVYFKHFTPLFSADENHPFSGNIKLTFH